MVLLGGVAAMVCSDAKIWLSGLQASDQEANSYLGNL